MGVQIMNKIEREIFGLKVFDFEKLIEYGFQKVEQVYILNKNILDGSMKVTITISGQDISSTIVDNDTGEEYTLHLVESFAGNFVGRVREEYEGLLTDIATKCCETEVFKSRQAKEIIAYCKKTYGDELEFLWEKFSDNAVLRRKDTGKWYAALLVVGKNKLGIDSEELTEILDIRMATEDIDKIVDGKTFFRGYHMNKKHWLAIDLKEVAKVEDILSYVDDSYELAKK